MLEFLSPSFVCCHRLWLFARFIGVNMLSMLIYLISFFLRYLDTFLFIYLHLLIRVRQYV